MATCALCLEERDLKTSHILPKFAQRRMKELARADDGPVMSHCAGVEKVVQNYCFERLLCDDCEQRFAAWEREGATLIRRPELLPLSLVRDKVLSLSGLPYATLKLFLMSMLWRMGASTLREFTFVDLGPHQERLRQMLLRADPGPPEAYGCSLQILTDRTGRIPFTRGADVHRADHLCRLYRLVLDGCLFVWQVGQTTAVRRSSTSNWLLQTDGTWDVCLQDRRQVPFVHDAMTPVLNRKRQGLPPRSPI